MFSLFFPKYYCLYFLLKDNMWDGNKYLLPVKSYTEPPTIKPTGERGIYLPFYYMTFDFKGLASFADVPV